MLRITAPELQQVTLGDSRKVRVGEPVAAIGAPFGFDNTVTSGIVSAKGRNLGDQLVPFLQTDAAVNPGNSGGPLFNLRGEVIGINSQIYSRSGAFSGLSFAIPIDLAMDIAKSLVAHGKVVRSKIGVGMQALTEDLAKGFGLATTDGALVNGVEPNGAADLAGVRAGDIVLKVNGQAVEHYLDLPRIVTSLVPGAAVRLTLWRDARELELVATAQPAAQDKTGEPLPVHPDQRLGLSLRTLSLDEELRHDVKQALLVEAVQAGSAAEKQGIKPSDLVLVVKGTPVASLGVLRELLAVPGKVPVLIQRGGNRMFLVVSVPTPAVD